MAPTPPRPPRALLVGILTPGRSPESLSASLDELSRLCDTLGMEEVGRLTQRRSSTRSAVPLGEGMLRIMARWTGGSGVVPRGPRDHKSREAPPAEAEGEELGEPLDEEEPEEPLDEEEAALPAAGRADVVVVDHELSPSQLRNLKGAAGAEVLDRTGVIIEIFHKRARSRAARAQVELARLTYLAPRLRELGGPSERQRGGIGGKGAGESDLELDRRKVRDQMAALRRELVELEGERGVRREKRRDLRQVALVGYTNAGKSSLMRALTGAEVYVEDRLFATLDTTVRRLHPPLFPDVLVTDTVGFIQDLPHSLVASFQSTLEAALDAGLLLHVVDASDPSWPEQEAVTAKVLGEIGAAELPRRLVFNKCDRLSSEVEEELRRQRPDAWFTSAHAPRRVAELHHHIAEHFQQGAMVAEIFIPWTASQDLGRVRAEVEVLEERYEDEGLRYRVRGPEAAVRRLQAHWSGGPTAEERGESE